MALGVSADQVWNLFSDFGQGSASTTQKQQSDNSNMPVDPAWIQAGSDVLGAALGGGASSSASQYSNFNNSGYTVATSGSRADGSPTIPWYVWVIAGVVLIKVFKRKKA